MPDDEKPKMSKKAWNLAVKDYYPTPQLINNPEVKDAACFAGPGITVREYFACEMMKAVLSSEGAIASAVEGGENILAERAVKATDALLEYLANNEPEYEPEQPT